jgi:fumarylacetoacetate (FAA) hydrolase
MKLASYRDGSRDGQLVVVSRDLASAHYATGIAGRLQQVLDDWNFLSPQLEELSQTLNHGRARHAFAFDPRLCMAPLPRAFLWVEARQTPGAPEGAPPRLVHGRSDALLGPRDPIHLPADDGTQPAPVNELDAVGQVAVVCGDLARGSEPASALEAVRLLVLANSIRPMADGDVAPSIALSPVAVTPDELGQAWACGRVQLNLERLRNGKRLGLCDLGADLPWHAGDLLTRLTRHRRLGAGSIVGLGATHREPAGSSDARGVALAIGDGLQLEVKGRDGQSVFGSIEQRVEQGD